MNSISPLAPASMDNPISVPGFRFATIAAELRYKNRDDLTLIACDEGTSVGGVFTRSSLCGHPITWCRSILKRRTARAVLINAGQANVFCGDFGDQTIIKKTARLASILDCEAEDIFVASTGVIGEPVPVDRLCGNLEALTNRLDDQALTSAAHAIMTTDTFAKWVSAETSVDDHEVKIAGIAKGSGMIEPNMATMLAYIVTDACITSRVAQALLEQANAKSFNAISVDGDCSTSDMVLLMASQKAGHPLIDDPDDPRLQGFRKTLERLMTRLALLVVKDGEGAQKLITIRVRGAQSDQSAMVIAKSVANSPLVKTAVAGGDANWGRIVMAVGKSPESIDPGSIAISFGGITTAAHGLPLPEIDYPGLDEYLRGRAIEIDIQVGRGDGIATAWTCDLTSRYIEINADYRS